MVWEQLWEQLWEQRPAWSGKGCRLVDSHIRKL